VKKRRQGVSEGNKSLESLWTKVSDLLIHSKVALHEENATLPPIILVHGLGVSSRYMMPFAKLLAAERSVCAIDLPGFGRSEKPRRALNITEQASALAAWLNEIEIPRAVLLANSIGCQIVIDLALRHPEMVERIILVSPTVDRWARTVFRQYFRLLLDIPREPLSLGFIAFGDYLRAGLGRVAQTFAFALEDKVEEKLPRVRQPTFVVRGERDPIVSERWAKEVTRLLPQGCLLVIEKAAHGVNYNSPERLARAVLDFLKVLSIE
jgi:2-hydroxy-6-oxonona-2,4-dienedioate hydrolase